MPVCSVVAFDIGVLLRLAGLNVLYGTAACLSPLAQTIADVFRAVVDSDGIRFPAPFNDPVEGARDACCRQSEVDLNAKAFAVEVIESIQHPEAPRVFKVVGYEVH